MSSVSSQPEVTAHDAAARGPILLLLGSALKWLVLAGVLSLVTSIQLIKPDFLADCSVLTHGRAVALAETAFVYGWLANAGLGVALWVLARLGGEALRAGNWTMVGTAFWNLGVTVGCIGIATGDATSFSLLQLPRYVQPLLAVAYAAIGVGGVLAWTGRRTAGTYASQWYAVAALFLFPWLFTAAQVVLFWSPVRGTMQAVAAGWFAQGAWTLWLAPLALSGAYYVVPKVTGRTLPSYDFAGLGFWTLIFTGAWTGGRHLIGGPVPAWIPTLGIVACSLLLFHTLIVGLNLRGAFFQSGAVLKFTAFGLAAYLAGGVLDALFSFRSLAEITQFTHFTTAQQQLAFTGGLSMMLFGSIYFAVPRLTGRAWASGGMISLHKLAATGGVLVLVGSLAMAGWIQGHALAEAKTSFAEISARTRPWLLAATAAQALLLFGNLLLAVNFLRSVCACCCGESAPTASPFRAPGVMEAPAS
ncbi:MAG: hypothetical protein RLZZ15_2804 [Verrucomicrobiota bacterium]